MKNLTKSQIESVIEWMNTWEQLKYTVIPIRFKEDYTKKLQQADVSDSYVVFEDSYDNEGLVQLSVTLPTLEKAREYVKAWKDLKSKQLYIYMLVE